MRNWLLARLSVIFLACVPALASNEAEEKAAAIWTLPEVRESVDFAGKEPSMLSLLGDLSQIREVRVIDFSTFVGDSLIFTFPMIAGFKHQFPHATIQVHQPNAHLIAPSEKIQILEPALTLSEASIEKLKATQHGEELNTIAGLQEFRDFESYLKSGEADSTLTYIDLGGLDFNIYKQLATHFGSGRKAEIGRAFVTLLMRRVRSLPSRVISLSGFLPVPHAPASLPEASKNTQYWKKLLETKDLLPDSMAAADIFNRYSLTEFRRRLIFGNRPLPAARAVFRTRIATDAEWEKFLGPSFLESSSGRPLVVINLVGGKPDKNLKYALKQWNFYSKLLPRMIRNYNVNVAIVPVDLNAIEASDVDISKMAQKVIRQIEALASLPEMQSRIKLLPATSRDPSLANRAIQEAQVVISADGGFVHVANLLNDPRRVITFSDDSSSEYWKIEEQPHYWDHEVRPKKLADTLLYHVRSILDPRIHPNQRYLPVHVPTPQCILEKTMGEVILRTLQTER